MLIHITAPHFCAGIDYDRGIFAPILRYMVGWPVVKIFKYCDWKGWTYTITEDKGENHEPSLER